MAHEQHDLSPVTSSCQAGFGHEDVDEQHSRLELWAYRLLCAAAFGAAFSLPLGRTMMGFSFLLLLVDCVRRRRRFAFSPAAWGWVVFLAVATFASVVGVDPARSFLKLEKLIWFVGIPVAATLAYNRARVCGILTAFVAGVGVLTLQIVVVRPVEAWFAMRHAVAAGEVGDYLRDITYLGSMTDGQTLMLGIVALAGLIAAGGVVWRRSVDLAGLVLFVAALVVNLKRGSWICTVVVMGAFAATRMKLRYLVMLAIATVVVLFLPPVWERFSDLRDEFDMTRGGRMVMWTRIAPPLIRAHPFGIGYRALTSEMMQNVAREQGVDVEPGRNHLHSNPIQILIATGWLGLAVYALWMGVGLINGFQRVFSAPRGSPDQSIALSLVLMLVGLILNGLVEYNFGDGELVMLYSMVLGMMGAAWSAMPGASELSSD